MADKRKPPIRQRPIQVKFFVDGKELDLIKQKMAQLGTKNMSAYLRKMAIDGYVVNTDMPKLRELTSKMKQISNSENQIAKQLNATGNIYEADIEEIKKNQEEIYEGIKNIPDRKPRIERINQIAHLRGIPHKGSLNLRNGHLSVANPGQQCLNGAIVYFILRHCTSPFPHLTAQATSGYRV